MLESIDVFETCIVIIFLALNYCQRKKSTKILKTLKTIFVAGMVFCSILEVFKTSLAKGASTLVGQQFLILEEPKGFGGNKSGVKRDALLCEKQ